MKIVDFIKNKKSYTFEGRIKSIRKMGIITFLTLLDRTGDMQIIIKKKVKKLKIGYLIKVKGIKKYNKKNLPILELSKIKILAKNYLLAPDKYHNIKNKKFIKKNKFFDTIIENSLLKVFHIRIKVIKMIRIYMYKRKFHEVETPIMDIKENSSNANNFVSFHKATKKKVFLRISPEISLKKTIIMGYKKIFEIGKNFRNEYISKNHYPEFTTIEFYVVKKNYLWSMIFLEKMIKRIIFSITKKKYLLHNNKKINYFKKFDILSIKECIKRYSKNKNKINIYYIKKKLKKICDKKELKILINSNKKIIRYIYFDKVISKNIIKPTFVIGFPTCFSILAKEKCKNIAERYELYFLKKELANGYTELNDYKEQFLRFKNQSLKNKKKIDKDFITYLKFGMQNCTGCGIGIDRLIMVVSKCEEIKDTLILSNFK
ncbi:amino acid--tRNA ligase-related protein [Candidatus Vidania fulgoroideorum]